ncbi:acyltransferase [Leptospira selangorensis]|uniref:acyltransferase family protein n=1 Tax=Leptospira selangorensis TaxID=2484982 RepID=UPI00108365FA|nr:acyltransferase [Leptospira selangorensis]TGK04662.1 acyltransferase [Leptospira selangorensis]
MKFFSYITEKRDEEYPALNGVRAISIMMIIGLHIWIGANHFIPNIPYLLDTALKNLTAGIDLFFILSGFLIYGNLLKEKVKYGNIKLSFFYIKRSLRIFPAYYFLLLVQYLSMRGMLKSLNAAENLDASKTLLKQSLTESISYAWADIFYISNYTKGRLFDYGWSLSIEEQFYLILPPLCALLFFKISDSTRRILLVGLYFIPVILRAVYSQFDILPTHIIYTHSETRFDSLIAGMLCSEFFLSSYYSNFFQKKPIRYSVLSVSIILAAIGFLTEKTAFTQIYAYNCLNLGFAGIVLVSLSENSYIGKFLSFSVFRPIARVSYTMYLWHLYPTSAAISIVCGTVIQSLSYSRTFATFIVAVLFTFLFCTILFYLIERPFLKLKDKWIARLKARSASTPN